MNALQQLAHWAATVSPEDHPHDWQCAVDWTKVALFDTIGCMIGGSGHPSPQLAYQTVAQWGNGVATVIGQVQPLAPPWAAFVNGAAAHALDFNAWDERSVSHSCPVLLAALLALAEVEGKSGAAVIEAFIVGMEVTMRIGAAVNLDHYHIGWHTTSTVAAIGCAAACGRLLGFDEAMMGHTISIATSQASGYKSQFGTPMKPIHCGMGAKTGVLSAYLAQSGITGSTEILDGGWSILTLQATDQAPGFSTALVDLGEALSLAKYGIIIKPYPSCAYTHRAIDGLRDLRTAHGLSTETVDHIVACIPFFNASILSYTHPTDDTQARFCMAYCLAITLRNGTVLPTDFDETVIFDPEVRAWLERITMTVHPVDAQSSDLETQDHDVVTVTLCDGTCLETQVDFARGMPQRPLNRSELETKFMNLARGKLDIDQYEQLVIQLWQFDHLEDVSTLLKPLQVGA